MISKEKLAEIKKIIEESINPLFLFDNDPDGICSAAILFRNAKKGNALVLKTIDKLNTQLKKKIFFSYPSDIFILDKPICDEEFVLLAKEKNIRLIFIDHHEQKKDSYSIYFNSFPSSEPTSFITQKVFDSKETRFLSLMGCISDVFLPDFFDEEKEKYPELFLNDKNPSKILYSTNFGKAVQILSLSLMNNNYEINKIFQYLTKINSPYDILIENEQNSFMHKKYFELNDFIEKNIKKAKVFRDFVYLEFSGKNSISSEIANRLFFLHSDKFIVVCYKKEDFINISLRGNNAKKIVKKILEKTTNSIGGGHEKACGLRIPILEYENFKKIISEEFSISF